MPGDATIDIGRYHNTASHVAGHCQRHAAAPSLAWAHSKASWQAAAFACASGNESLSRYRHKTLWGIRLVRYQSSTELGEEHGLSGSRTKHSAPRMALGSSKLGVSSNSQRQ